MGVGETRPGGEVVGFDSSKPGRFYWESSDSVEVEDEGPNDGEVVGVEGCRGCPSRGMDGGDGVVFWSEREAPKLGAGGASPSFK